MSPVTRRTGTGVQRWRAWLGASAVSGAIAAAMIGTAAVAAADTDSPSSGGSSASSSAESSPPSASGDSARDDTPEDRDTKGDRPGADESASDDRDTPDDPASADLSEGDRAPRHRDPAGKPDKRRPSAEDSQDVSDPDVESEVTVVEPGPDLQQHPASVRTRQTRRPPADDVDTTVSAGANVLQTRTEAATVTLTPPPAESAATAKLRSPSLLEVVSAVVFNMITAVERLVTGPPVLPPGSRVTVRSSRLQIADGLSVPADWYYPDGDEPPERMIVLQHGFLAIGPMYSYTAAALAERTHSIVVAPTLTSNPLAQGGMWLGGNGMHRAVADLFVGDRETLTASAVAAGYAERYGLDPATAALPEKFALAGHSLGGALVSGTAGYLVDNGAAADLVGVILLDGVPRDGQLSTALAKLDAYEQATGHFIPVREIGAPWNVWNSTSHVDSDLAQARPGRYVGVVLRGGVHMDPMRGGNPLIQLAAYLAAGFPQPQNPPAVIDLSVDWLGDWFAGRTDVGDDLAPGSTIVIPTPEGPARGVVIGHAAAPAVAPGRLLVRAA